jgi:hypothetical protein
MCGREHDDHAFLAGHEHVAVAEPPEDDALQRIRGRLDRREPLSSLHGLCERHLMVTGQVEPERLAALHQLTEVGISAQKVLHQLSAKGLLAPDQLSNGHGVALGKGGDCIVDDLEHRLGRRSHRPAVAFPHNGR